VRTKLRRFLVRMLGRWRDNAPGGDPIGTLVIGNGSISVGRLVTYRVRPVAAFGDGQLFEVLGLNRKRDPEGWGRTARFATLLSSRCLRLWPASLTP
jgi:hypothetical protein